MDMMANQATRNQERLDAMVREAEARYKHEVSKGLKSEAEIKSQLDRRSTPAQHTSYTPTITTSNRFDGLQLDNDE